MPPVTVIAIFTVLNASGFLICTNTEGPSRDRALSFYILIITVLTSDVHGEKHHTCLLYTSDAADE